jgi:hypothetical protein
MPKQLIFVSAIVLCLCAIISSLVNFETVGLPKSQRELTLLDIQPFNQIDWRAVLSQLPQYKKVEMKTEPNKLSVPEIRISDGQIIGIVVDDPASVLIFLSHTKNQEPLMLSVSEGWLTNWVIKQINADSVDWYNNLTQQSYKQPLFNHSSS